MLFSYLIHRELLAKAASGKSSGSGSLCSLLEAQNADGYTALHLACGRGSAELVEAILAYEEADVAILDKDGDPPIVLALAAGSPDCVRALINRSADVSSWMREGQSITHLCACSGHPKCMQVCVHICVIVFTVVISSLHINVF